MTTTTPLQLATGDLSHEPTELERQLALRLQLGEPEVLLALSNALSAHAHSRHITDQHKRAQLVRACLDLFALSESLG